MAQITQEELQRRLNSGKNLVNKLPEQKNVTVLRPDRLHNVEQVKSPTVRAIAGALAHTESPRTVAAAFDMTINQVMSAKSSGNPEVKDKRESALERVRDLAIDKLMASLNLLTEDRMENCKATEVSRVAADMSRIIEKTSGDKGAGNSTQILIYAPQQRNIKSFDVLDV